MRILTFGYILLFFSGSAHAQLDAGNIGSNATICYATAPQVLSCSPSGGIQPYTYHWERLDQGSSTWASISTRTNQAVYSPPILTSTTSFRVRVTDNNSNEDYSNEVVINVYSDLQAGTIGDAQTICYGSAPLELYGKQDPEGGSYSYAFQWQTSVDSLIWSDISGAYQTNYSSSGLDRNTWFRRLVNDAICGTKSSNKVKITLNAQAITAQLHDNITVNNNSSADFRISLTGGSSSYTVHYTLNGTPHSPIYNYTSGTDISTGTLTTGSYIYALTSVTSGGCSANTLGTPITVSVGPTNKALVVVNSGSDYFEDYIKFIKPYLDNFGIPYEECDVSSSSLQGLGNFGVIIFGHRQVYNSGGYPVSALESAVSAGVGLYSFDPVLFEDSNSFSSTLTSPRSASSNEVDIITAPANYITQLHINDEFDNSDGTPNNNPVTLRARWAVEQTNELINGFTLAEVGSVPVLEGSDFGNGRIVKWNNYDWVKEDILGPVYGMDDLIWRGIVWSSRKPFAMQGMPPFVTFRVDDVAGNSSYYPGGNIIDNFRWIYICHDFGIVPWCGTFNEWIRTSQIPTLRSLLNNGYATASPHANGNNFIYFDHQNELFNVAQTTQNALNFYETNGLPLSKFVVPHWYELNSEALPVMHAAGIEFLGIRIPPDNWQNPPLTYQTQVTPWINGGPYRIDRNGYFFENPDRPLYYGAPVTLNGIQFFLCFTEINDDGYDWSPSTVDAAVSRGIRQLRRCFNSMVLATIFSHEYFFPNLVETDLRSIFSQIESTIAPYNPEYNITMDHALEYIRARNNIRITNVTSDASNYYVSYTGNNDMDTRCYLFTELGGVISYRFVTLNQVTNGSNTVISPR